MEQITDEGEIYRLVPEWQALWMKLPNATPFQSPQWLLPWWNYFGNSAPSVVTARSGEELIGVLPLYLLQEAGRRKLLPFGISLSDYMDALVEPEHPGLGDTLLAWLVDIPGWDELYIPDLAPTAALLAAECPGVLLENRVGGEHCPVLTLPSNFESLREVVPRKTLRDLRQARSQAAAADELTVTRADAATVSEFMHEFFRLHERRWQRLAGRGVYADSRVRRFHLAAAQRMLDAGMLRLYLLWLGNTPASAYFGFTAKGRAYAYLSGFDPDRADFSPGTQIVGHAIEEAIREGAHEFHFLRGSEAYKYAWGAVDRPNTARILRRTC